MDLASVISMMISEEVGQGSEDRVGLMVGDMKISSHMIVVARSTECARHPYSI